MQLAKWQSGKVTKCAEAAKIMEFANFATLSRQKTNNRILRYRKI